MNESILRSGLLLAMPRSSDPNLSGTVLLLVEHRARRSLTLAINRPSSVTANELLASLGMPWRGRGSDVVWCGGPVEPHKGWVLHDTLATPQTAGTISITPAISISTTPERLRALASDPTRGIRILLGSIDWAVGELAGAVLRGGVYTEATPDLVFDTAPELLWRRVQSIGAALPDTGGGLRGAILRLLGKRAIPKAIMHRR